MQARADWPPGGACRREVPPPPVDVRDHLLRLVQQVAIGDRTALADLYRVLSSALVEVLRGQAVDSADAAAVVSATFNEVWWMARFHISADADIHAWMVDMVRRRAADRSRGAGRDALVSGAVDRCNGSSMGGGSAAYDQHLDSALCSLFGSPSGDFSCSPPLPER